MLEYPAWLRTWSLMTDPRAWLLILVALAATMVRTGAYRSRWFDLLKPWKARPRDKETGLAIRDPNRPHPLRDPWFLFLLILASTAVVAWIVMSMTVKTQGRP